MKKLRNLQRLLREWPAIAERIATKHLNLPHTKASLEDMNILQLQLRGLRADGVSLGEYAEMTIRIKQFKGQETRWVTLKDEGDFYKSIFVTVANREIYYDATDWKTGMLTERYGDAILGLPKADLPAVRKELRNVFRAEMRTRIAHALSR